MKLQYLGTAAAEGIPSLFCRCEVCKRARERGGREIRSRSQAVVNGRLLIDFPSDSFGHCTAWDLDLSQIDSCIITHVHGDHTFPWEFYHLKKGNSTLPEEYGGFHLYGSEDILSRFADPEKGSSGRLRLHTVKPFESFELCGLTVTPLKANHGTAHPYIYMIEEDGHALLYAHDTDMLPEETWEFLRERHVRFDLVSLDCTGGAAEDLGKYCHMYLGVNKKCRARLLEYGLADEKTVFVLNHFSHNGLQVNYKEFCEIAEPLGFEVSYDGMEVIIC